MICTSPRSPQTDGHHEYHADGGHEARGDPVRVIAFLFYLNDVSGGR